MKIDLKHIISYPIIFIFVKMNKINFYIFGEIFRGFLLILFIFYLLLGYFNLQD